MTRRSLSAGAALAIVLAAGALSGPFAGRAEAGTAIERACLQSDRAANNRRLCGCIQDVADATLTGRDQRQAARFFADPQRAQDVRQSGSSSDSAFWQRYRRFGDAAESYCRR